MLPHIITHSLVFLLLITREFHGSNCPGQFPRGNHLGVKFHGVIVLGGFHGGQFSKGELVRDNYPWSKCLGGGNCPGENFMGVNCPGRAGKLSMRNYHWTQLRQKIFWKKCAVDLDVNDKKFSISEMKKSSKVIIIV